MTRFPDAALFRPEAISRETLEANDELAARLRALPPSTSMIESRERFAKGDGPIPATPKSPRATSLTIPSNDGAKVGLRIVAPSAPRGVYLHIHGGGWCLGSADMRDGDLERICDRVGLACISVDYRLAPEHPYPAGPDDCHAAASWLIENSEEMFGARRLAIGGESAGAHLSAVTLLRLRDAGLGDAFCCANLVFGAYDLSLTPSSMVAASTLVTNRSRMEMVRSAFLPSGADPRTPDISPLYADLRGLPPALFTVGTLDPLIDDSLFMFARWTAAGNEAEIAVYPGGVHGFTAFGGALAQAAKDRSDAFLTRQFECVLQARTPAA